MKTTLKKRAKARAQLWIESRLPFRPFLEKLNDEHSKKYPIPKSPTAGEIMKRICSYKAVDSTHTPSSPW